MILGLWEDERRFWGISFAEGCSLVYRGLPMSISSDDDEIDALPISSLIRGERREEGNLNGRMGCRGRLADIPVVVESEEEENDRSVLRDEFDKVPISSFLQRGRREGGPNGGMDCSGDGKPVLEESEDGSDLRVLAADEFLSLFKSLYLQRERGKEGNSNGEMDCSSLDKPILEESEEENDVRVLEEDNDVRILQEADGKVESFCSRSSETGDIVWAKEVPYQSGPGWILKRENHMVLVSFYQSGKNKWFKESEVQCFEENYARMMRIGGRKLCDAVDLALKDFCLRVCLGLMCPCMNPGKDTERDQLGSARNHLAKLAGREENLFQPADVLHFVLRMAVFTWVESMEDVSLARAAAQVNAYRRYVSMESDVISHDPLSNEMESMFQEAEGTLSVAEQKDKNEVPTEQNLRYWEFCVSNTEDFSAIFPDDEVQEVADSSISMQKDNGNKETIEDQNSAKTCTIEQADTEEIVFRGIFGVEPVSQTLNIGTGGMESMIQEAEGTLSVAERKQQKDKNEVHKDQDPRYWEFCKTMREDLSAIVPDNDVESLFDDQIEQVGDSSMSMEKDYGNKEILKGQNSSKTCALEQSDNVEMSTSSMTGLEAVNQTLNTGTELLTDMGPIFTGFTTFNRKKIEALSASGLQVHLHGDADSKSLSETILGTEREMCQDESADSIGVNEIDSSLRKGVSLFFNGQKDTLAEKEVHESITCLPKTTPDKLQLPFDMSLESQSRTEPPISSRSKTLSLSEMLSHLHSLALDTFYSGAGSLKSIKRKLLKYRTLVYQNISFQEQNDTVVDTESSSCLPLSSCGKPQLPSDIALELQSQTEAPISNKSKSHSLNEMLIHLHFLALDPFYSGRESLKSIKRKILKYRTLTYQNISTLLSTDSSVFGREFKVSKVEGYANELLSHLNSNLSKTCPGNKASVTMGGTSNHQIFVSDGCVDTPVIHKETITANRATLTCPIDSSATSSQGKRRLDEPVTSDLLFKLHKTLPLASYLEFDRGSSNAVMETRPQVPNDPVEPPVRLRRRQTCLPNQNITGSLCKMLKHSLECGHGSKVNEAQELAGFEFSLPSGVNAMKSHSDDKAVLANCLTKTCHLLTHKSSNSTKAPPSNKAVVTANVIDHKIDNRKETRSLEFLQVGSGPEQLPCLRIDAAKANKTGLTNSATGETGLLFHHSNVSSKIQPICGAGTNGKGNSVVVVHNSSFPKDVSMDGSQKKRRLDQPISSDLSFKFRKTAPVGLLKRLYASPLSKDSSNTMNNVEKSRGGNPQLGNPTLSMKFPKDFNLPSKEALERKFSIFGPLDRSRTRVFFYTGSAEVVFLYQHCAEFAYQYVRKKSLFGQANVRFWLNHQNASSNLGAWGRALPLSTAGQQASNLKSCLKRPNAHTGNKQRKTKCVKFLPVNQHSSFEENVARSKRTLSDSCNHSMEVVPDISLQMLLLLEKCKNAVHDIRSHHGLVSYYSVFVHSSTHFTSYR